MLRGATLGAILATLGASAIGAMGVACAASYGAEDAPTDGGSSDAPGTDGTAPIVIPKDCDLSKAPKDSPACIDDGVAIFVAPAGNDSANGAKNAPVATVARAVELSQASGRPRVYVCEGNYDKPATVTSALAIYGGLSCSWTPNGAKPRLAPPSGVALTIRGVSGAALVQDFAIDGAANPSKAGDSAIGVFVATSSNVTLRNVTITAGAGTDGGKAPPHDNYVIGMTAANGNSAVMSFGGPAALCMCKDGTRSTGGAGAGMLGTPSSGTATPAVGVANVGTSAPLSCTDGLAGTNGNAGIDATPSMSVDAISAMGWQAAQAPPAPDGAPGQGGGGGGAKTMPTNAGGGGGCGGCGGGGGAAGPSGGSSFALLSFNSSITFDGGSLASGRAGRGGNGGDGQPGQEGGAGGTGAGCNGGTGGAGGAGSGGPGGGGGHSAAIAWNALMPTTTNAMLTHGTSGAAGAGGMAAGGMTSPGPDGSAGRADTALRF